MSLNIPVDDAFKRLQLDHYNKQFFSKGNRFDGRKFIEFREVLVNFDCINTADSSAIVKLGNTSVLCGIKIVKNDAISETNGIAYNDVIDLKFNLNSLEPEKRNTFIEFTINKILQNNQLFDYKHLILENDNQEKVYLSLLIELIGINNDGNLLDACLIALISSLQLCPIPSINEMEAQTSYKEKKKRIMLQKIPISITSALIGNDILLDPCYEEENLSIGSLSLVFDVLSEDILLMEKSGGNPISETTLLSLINTCQNKAKKLYKSGLIRKTK